MNRLVILAQTAACDRPQRGWRIGHEPAWFAGAAGAAVAVTYYFLIFLKDQSEKQNRLFEDFKDYHSESQKKFQDQLDRLSDRQEQSQRGFQDQVTRITEAQNVLLRDAIVAMKAVEKSQDTAADTVRGIERTISSLQAAIAAIDMLVHRLLDVRGPSASKKISPGASQ